MTKKIAFLSIVLFIAAILLNQNYAHTDADKPPKQITGAPAFGGISAESTCAKSGCHSNLGGPNTGSGSVVIDFNNGDLNYTPNTTYTISVTINKGNETASRYGFEMTALNANGTKSGVFSENNTNIEIGSTNGREYIYHRNAANNNSNIATFSWTSPAQNDGVITFYVSGNAANGNNSKTDDRIYTSSKSINFLGVGVNSVASNLNINVFPNPASNYIQVSYALKNTNTVAINLYDLTGKLISNLQQQAVQSASKYNTIFDINTFSNGVYVVAISAGKETQACKIIIKK